MEEKALGPSPLRLATSPPQGDHVLVDLFSSMADEGLCGKAPPQVMKHLHEATHCGRDSLTMYVKLWLTDPGISIEP